MSDAGEYCLWFTSGLGYLAGLASARIYASCRPSRFSAHSEHRLGRDDHRFAALYDNLLQDMQGLTLSLQAVADQLPPDDPLRRRLEALLNRTDTLVDEGQRRAHRGGSPEDGP